MMLRSVPWISGAPILPSRPIRRFTKLMPPSTASTFSLKEPLNRKAKVPSPYCRARLSRETITDPRSRLRFEIRLIAPSIDGHTTSPSKVISSPSVSVRPPSAFAVIVPNPIRFSPPVS